MCGRFAMYSTAQALEEEFGMSLDVEPNKNISPGMHIVTFTSQPAMRFWQLPLGTHKLINVRAETITPKLTYLKPCLIPANGFYEWKNKIPYYFESDGLFSFAGVYNEHGCAIVTCRPSDVVTSIHDRMPVILPKEKRKIWLNADTSVLVPFDKLRINQENNVLLKGQRTL